MTDEPDTEDRGEAAPSLLPYDEWTEWALRQVVGRALASVAGAGLPGEHHFYITFRTDHPGVVVPPRLKAQYPQEMTIVLQHQFWDLKMDEEADLFTVGLSFGGVPSTLAVPLASVTGFADPHARFALRFRPQHIEAAEPDSEATPQTEEPTEEQREPKQEAPQVVSLDAFRRRTPGKD